MLAVDPSAKVAPGAVIGADVKIGPYCVIGPNVAIGDGCELIAHVHLAGHTTIGAGTVIYPFASLGTPPQSVHYKGGPTRLVDRREVPDPRERHHQHRHREGRRRHHASATTAS